MKVYTKEEAEINFKDIAQAIEEGALFIYPTDTIYGIGCNALDEEAVNKLREVKQRMDDPFSIIAPSNGLWRTAKSQIQTGLISFQEHTHLS